MNLKKHIISIIIAVIVLIIGEYKTNSIELENSPNPQSLIEFVYDCDYQTLDQEIQSQLLSYVTHRTTNHSKRVNNIPKEDYKIGYSKKNYDSLVREYIIAKPTTFYFPFSNANLRLISFGKLII